MVICSALLWDGRNEHENEFSVWKECSVGGGGWCGCRLVKAVSLHLSFRGLLSLDSFLSFSLAVVVWTAQVMYKEEHSRRRRSVHKAMYLFVGFLKLCLVFCTISNSKWTTEAFQIELLDGTQEYGEEEVYKYLLIVRCELCRSFQCESIE